jgi:vacuolar iron transporter family protein
MIKEKPYNSKYLHYKKKEYGSTLRELVFGMEDGMVSTMGAITGIAIGSGSHSMVVLSGFVIIAVESISMGVGSYLSNKSESDREERILAEEREEIADMPEEEEKELLGWLIADGWSKELAVKMAQEAKGKPELMLHEMAYRELKMMPHNEGNSIKNGFTMWGSYIVGGLIPLVPYLLFTNTTEAIPISVGVTLVGLFALGAYVTKFSLRSWWKGGMEMLVLAGLAGAVGYAVGHYASMIM